MSRVPSKHERDHALDFQGFLNDLQDWELSQKDKDKKMKAEASGKVGDFSRNFDAISSLSSSFMAKETTPDAASEKELGNEYFKQKKFKEAIDCYSRSIALSPTAVAYANRAMAYLKIRRFHEAEDDCTEALDLDDRYVKAYSRRATARKELGKLKESVEDLEFALRLEPNNQEIRKQHAEVKSLYGKEIVEKSSLALRSPVQGGKLETKMNGVSSLSQSSGEDKAKENDGKVLRKKPVSVEEVESKVIRAGSTTQGPEAYVRESIQQRNRRSGRQELKASVQELASRAASRAMSEAAKTITPPNSAYQFEVSWHGFSGDQSLQACLLKATSPSELPRIFKNALSAPLLIDIIKCVATFFIDDMDLAVKYLENLTKVPRFDMLVMFLSSADKADLLKIWDEVFCSEATPIECAELLDNLRSKYCLR